MAIKVKPKRKAKAIQRASAQSPTGIFSGTAQAGAARKKRAHALAEELLARGNLYIQSQVWDEAAREFRKAIKMEEDFAEAYNNLGLCLLYANKPEEAVESLQAALHYLPHWDVAEANLGLAYQRMQHHQEAADCYTASLNKKRAQPSVWMALGDALTALGRADEALQAYTTAVELSPKYDMCFTRIGMLQARRNRVDEAKAALSKAIQIEPDNPEAHAVLGAISARQGSFNEARDYFQQALEVEPPPGPAVKGMNRLQVFWQGVRRGFDEWKTGAPQTPTLAVCFYNLGLAQMQAGNEAAAKDAFQQAAELQSDWAEPIIWFGFFAALDGDGPSAREYFDKAKALEPDNGMLFEELAYVALGQGLQKEADTNFNKALDLGREIPEEDLKPDVGASGMRPSVS